MIRINLLPPEERPASRSINVPKSPALLAIGLFLLVALPIAVTSIKQSATHAALKESVEEARAEATRLKPEIDRIHLLNRQTQELNHRIQVVADLDKSSTYYVEVLDDISQVLPMHMWLTRIEEDPKRPGIATVEGYTFTNLLVADLMVRFEKLGHFKDVVLVQIERTAVEGRDVLRFEIEVRLNKGEQKEERREHP